jgi:CubicO group peptidase (beta-lactamase class C family)
MTVKTKNGIEKAKNPIRIHHLFEMTAGLNYNLQTPALKEYYAAGDGRCPTVELVNQLAKSPLEFEPGEGWLYSLAHDVLAALLEVLTGEKFEDYVREHIFEPLGMTRTDFLLPMEEYRNIIPLYRGCEDGSVIPHFLGNVPSYRIGIEHASGGAGCASTVEDYMKFLEALRTGEKLLKRETIRMMATNRLTPAQREGFKLRQNYGYGLGVRVADEGSGRYDFGWGGAAGAYLAVDETHNMTMYYAQHVILSPNVDQRGKIYTTVLEELEGIIAREQAADPELNKLTY